MTMANPLGSFTVPNVCPHGMAWSLPCASCNRPTPVGGSSIDSRAIYELADAIRELARALAAKEPKP